ncbi:hypothetical protein [Pseudomonas marincola]|nr:hypothetical protein [Pseudomonas marincola]SFT78016.1 hypothetical protein SAMN05216264_10486 [Pseudomonas marincola]
MNDIYMVVAAFWLLSVAVTVWPLVKKPAHRSNGEQATRNTPQTK